MDITCLFINKKVWKALILEGTNKDKYVAVKKIDLDKYADEKLEEIRVFIFFSHRKL